RHTCLSMVPAPLCNSLQLLSKLDEFMPGNLSKYPLNPTSLQALCSWRLPKIRSTDLTVEAARPLVRAEPTQGIYPCMALVRIEFPFGLSRSRKRAICG